MLIVVCSLLIQTTFGLKQVETYHADVEMYREAYTYFNITKSDLEPVVMAGSVAKVSRGWGQALILPAEDLSVDPDWPGETVRYKNIAKCYWDQAFLTNRILKPVANPTKSGEKRFHKNCFCFF